MWGFWRIYWERQDLRMLILLHNPETSKCVLLILSISNSYAALPHSPWLNTILILKGITQFFEPGEKTWWVNSLDMVMVCCQRCRSFTHAGDGPVSDAPKHRTSSQQEVSSSCHLNIFLTSTRPYAYFWASYMLLTTQWCLMKNKITTKTLDSRGLTGLTVL